MNESPEIEKDDTRGQEAVSKSCEEELRGGHNRSGSNVTGRHKALHRFGIGDFASRSRRICRVYSTPVDDVSFEDCQLLP